MRILGETSSGRRSPYRQKCAQDGAFHTTFATQSRRHRADVASTFSCRGVLPRRSGGQPHAESVPHRQESAQEQAFHTTFATQLRRRRAATQQLRPAMQQLPPDTQQLRPATQQRRPATPQRRPAAQQLRPAAQQQRLAQQRRPAMQRRRSAAGGECFTAYAKAGKFSMVRKVPPKGGNFLDWHNFRPQPEIQFCPAFGLRQSFRTGTVSPRPDIPAKTFA
eukprot:gene9402-biopygen5073